MQHAVGYLLCAVSGVLLWWLVLAAGWWAIVPVLVAYFSGALLGHPGRRRERALRQLVEAFRWKARLCRGEFEPATGVSQRPPAEVVFDRCANDLEAVLDGEEDRP